MRTTSGKATLRRAFRHLEREVPERVAWAVRNLRHPHARWLRLPASVLLVLGGMFSILPFLGIWMLPLGLLLIAYDVAFLREPVGRFTIGAPGSGLRSASGFSGNRLKGSWFDATVIGSMHPHPLLVTEHTQSAGGYDSKSGFVCFAQPMPH
jgi:hypothetical protein